MTAFVSTAVFAHTSTVKTNHSDVNLWSEAGRKGSDQIDRIKRFEEVEVLLTKKLRNGETWYQVRLRRLPEWRPIDRIGWVDAKFFTKIDKPTEDDQPTDQEATVKENCPQCLAKPRGNNGTSNAQDLADVATAAKKQASSKGFIRPVEGVVKSGFGMRVHPIHGYKKLHNGTDFSRNNGKPVVASKSGRIIKAIGGCFASQSKKAKNCNKGAGNYVVIDHRDGTQTKYLHLNESCPLPRVGQEVTQGQKIACVGNTGGSTGPHLHFSVLINGKYVNPLTVLPPER